MKRVVSSLAFVSAMALSASGAAQEIQIRGPLAGAPSCRRCVQYRVGRVSVSPTYGLSIQDEFDRVMLFGVQVNYYPVDILGIGVWGAFAGVHMPTPLAVAVRRQLASPDPTMPLSDAAIDAQANTDLATPPTTPWTANTPRGERFYRQLGQVNAIAALQLSLIPLRGKLALFQSIVLDADFYITAGPALVWVTERTDFDLLNTTTGIPDPVASRWTDLQSNQVARSTRMAPTGVFGAGLNFYINRFLSLSVEYRGYPLAWNTSGWDENTAARTCFDTSGNARPTSCAGFSDQQVNQDTNGGGRFLLNSVDRGLRWNQMVNFSINVFLPTEPARGN